MSTEQFFLLAADAILIVHVFFVLFVIGGLVAVYLGYWLSWAWVCNFWFRLSHLAAIVIVMFESWISMVCPLTVWEMTLREKGRGSVYEGSFIQHWLQAILYYDAPEWVFVVAYTLFGFLIVASWFLVPPKRRE